MDIHNFFIDKSNLLGVTPAALKVVTLQLLAFPLALIFNTLPKTNPIPRHLFSIFASAFFYCTLFDTKGFIQMTFVSLVVYTICAKNKSASWMPYLIMVLSMSYLSYCHLDGFLIEGDSSRFDNTAPVMILVIKWTSFAWCTYDASKLPKHLTLEQNKFAIRQYPSLIEYFGFTFFYCGFLVGPAFEFREYQQFINDKAPFDKAPSPYAATLECIITAFIFLGIYVHYAPIYTISVSTTPDFYNNYSIWDKFVFFNICGVLLRTKFYTVWKLAEGACILSGLGYIGYDPKTLKPDFSRVQNIVIRNVELPENPRMMMNNWNMNTQKWLRNHVYLRLINSNQTNSAFVTLVTFMVSALWHGFHPGYYISFLFVSFYIMCGRLLRKHVRPFVVSGKLSGLKQLYDLMGCLMSWSVTNFLVAPFQLLELKGSLIAWGSMWYYQQIIMVSLIIGFTYLKWGKILQRFQVKMNCDVVEDERVKLKSQTIGGVNDNVKKQ